MNHNGDRKTRTNLPTPARCALPVAKRSRRRASWIASAAITVAVVGAAVGLAASGGCVAIAARLIAYAPNHGRSIDTQRPTDAAELRERGVNESLRVRVGPPEASLAVWIVEPQGPARGTILYLHGIFDSKSSLLPTAHSHAQRGYRGVLVDSRGHGESTGEWLTYGAQEAEDYSQVLDELQRRGLLAGRLGVYGCSYGAGVAVQLAGRDDRIAAAVVLAPFSSMREIVLARVRSLHLDWAFNERTIAAAIERAGELAGFDPAKADGVAALGYRALPLLVIHGQEDRTIPSEQGVRLCAAAGRDARLVLIPGATHDDWTDAGRASLWIESSAWFDDWLAPRPGR
ncbi:MAG: alpha/beta fold hydrolase [Phycisphaerae bacterium]|jgi:hypothetical protein